MNKVISFVRMDYIMIKPYLTFRTIILLAVLLVFMSVNTDIGASIIGMIMMYGAMCVTYPFAVGEKCNIDSLYATLSLKRGEVVLGRYLFALTAGLCAGAIGLMFFFGISTVRHMSFSLKEAMVVLFIVFQLYCIMLAIQLPIYFKLGYTKAKIIAFFPLFVIPMIIGLFSKVLTTGSSNSLLGLTMGGYQWILENPYMAVVVWAVLWVGIMTVSFKISRACYCNRDF